MKQSYPVLSNACLFLVVLYVNYWFHILNIRLQGNTAGLMVGLCGIQTGVRVNQAEELERDAWRLNSTGIGMILIAAESLCLYANTLLVMTSALCLVIFFLNIPGNLNCAKFNEKARKCQWQVVLLSFLNTEFFGMKRVATYPKSFPAQLTVFL